MRERIFKARARFRQSETPTAQAAESPARTVEDIIEEVAGRD